MNLRELRDAVEAELEFPTTEIAMVEAARPRTRGQCGTARPCPFVSCRYHLALDVTAAGSLVLSAEALDDMAETCALDVADRGANGLSVIARALGVTRQRVEQIVRAAEAKCAAVQR